MTIKVLTNVRADGFFLNLWIRYYGSLFGRENLHVMLDGDDWSPDGDVSGVNFHIVKDVPRHRAERLRFTSVWQSNFTNRLLKRGSADTVLRTDIDEFVAIDPIADQDLPSYLNALAPCSMCAALGLDVIHGPHEVKLRPAHPILEQRRNAIITREFCKLVAVRERVRWKGGFHRGVNVPIDIGSNLLLFHLALFDRDIAKQRVAGRGSILQDVTQSDHIINRLDRFSEVESTQPLVFDAVVDRARQQIMQSVPSKTGPHPGFITDGNVTRGYHVQIPDRMVALLPATDGNR